MSRAARHTAGRLTRILDHRAEREERNLAQDHGARGQLLDSWHESRHNAVGQRQSLIPTDGSEQESSSMDSIITLCKKVGSLAAGCVRSKIYVCITESIYNGSID